MELTREVESPICESMGKRVSSGVQDCPGGQNPLLL